MLALSFVCCTLGTGLWTTPSIKAWLWSCSSVEVVGRRAAVYLEKGVSQAHECSGRLWARTHIHVCRFSRACFVKGLRALSPKCLLGRRCAGNGRRRLDSGVGKAYSTYTIGCGYIYTCFLGICISSIRAFSPRLILCLTPDTGNELRLNALHMQQILIQSESVKSVYVVTSGHGLTGIIHCDS